MKPGLALVISEPEAADFVTQDAKFVGVTGKGAAFALTKSHDPDVVLAVDAQWLNPAAMQSLRHLAPRAVIVAMSEGYSDRQAKQLVMAGADFCGRVKQGRIGLVIRAAFRVFRQRRGETVLSPPSLH